MSSETKAGRTLQFVSGFVRGASAGFLMSLARALT